MDLKIDRKTQTNLVTVSPALRKYLTMKMMMKEKHTDDIFEADIDEMLENFKRKNEKRTNLIRISGEIAIEFIDLIKDKVKQKNLDLGIIEIDIGGKDFSIKDLLEKTKDISYILKVKILSIKDLRKEEVEFLNTRYGIIYIYADNEYHIDELFKIVDNMKKLIRKNEKRIVSKEKDIKRACAIADIVFKNFKLIVPAMYVHPQKEVTFRNGEKMRLPTFRIIQNTSKYENLENIFSRNAADIAGMRKVYRECLRNDGFELIERVESALGTVGREFSIDNKDYGILVEEDGIKILEMKKRNT